MSTLDKFRSFMLELWPRGRAWNRESDSLFFDTSEGMAVELTRIDDRSKNLEKEADPRTTFELLKDWEKMLGIPDECSGLEGTIAERVAVVVRKLTSRGGNTLSKPFLIALAATLGYTITIEEPGVNMFRCGVSRCGDRLYGALWRFWIQVVTDTFVLGVFRAGTNRAGDRLRTFENTELECVIEKAKPAHISVQFIYGS